MTEKGSDSEHSCMYTEDHCENQMSDLRNRLISFLSESYKPVTICAPARAWQSLNYKNRVFEIRTVCTNKEGNYVELTILNPNYGPFFISNAIDGTKIVNQIELKNDQNENICLTKVNLDTILSLSFESNIDIGISNMICDFVLKDCKMTEGKPIKELWEKKLESFDEEKLLKIVKSSRLASTKYGNIVKVEQAPDYSSIKDKYVKELQLIDVKPSISINNLFDIKENDFDYSYNMRGYSGNLYVYDESVKRRFWYTGDGWMSGPAWIFAQECKKYRSYNDQVPLTTIYKFEGGFELRFTSRSLWNKFINETYTEIVGNQKYYTGTHMNLEDFVILEEALKHQGAKIKQEFHNY